MISSIKKFLFQSLRLDSHVLIGWQRKHAYTTCKPRAMPPKEPLKSNGYTTPALALMKNLVK